MTYLLIFFAIIAGHTLIYNLSIYLFTSIFGVRVEKFYVFFDVKFALLKKKIGKTEFGLGWVPFGGYLKIVGFGGEPSEEIPADSFSKLSFIKQYLVLFAGPLSNLIVGLLVYAYVFTFTPSQSFASIGIIVLLLAGYAILVNFILTLNRNRGKITTAKKDLFFLASMIVYCALMVTIAYLVNQVFPLFDCFEKLWQGNLMDSYFNTPDSSFNFYFFVALLGVLLFFFNLLPLSGMTGFNLLKAIYRFFSGEAISDKFQAIFGLISLPFLLVIFGWFLYQFIVVSLG